jgi:hypothetical protein
MGQYATNLHTDWKALISNQKSTFSNKTAQPEDEEEAGFILNETNKWVDPYQESKEQNY